MANMRIKNLCSYWTILQNLKNCPVGIKKNNNLGINSLKIAIIWELIPKLLLFFITTFIATFIKTFITTFNYAKLRFAPPSVSLRSPASPHSGAASSRRNIKEEL